MAQATGDSRSKHFEEKKMDVIDMRFNPADPSQIDTIASIIRTGNVTMVTNSMNGVARVWEKGGFASIYDGHADSRGKNLLVDINRGAEMATGAILAILALEGKKIKMTRREGVEIYTVL
ncbi:MAG: hypothetical protein WC217_01805 [Candidatus Paceibacterota bacterium]